MTSRVKAKVTIAKLFELAYAQDKGLTTKISTGTKNFKITVDQNGNAVLSGAAGSVTFKGEPALSSLGAKIKNISVSFSHGEEKRIKYTAMYSFGGAMDISLSGSFDIEKLLLACSGLLCRAARALKGNYSAYDMQLEKVMGY